MTWIQGPVQYIFESYSYYDYETKSIPVSQRSMLKSFRWISQPKSIKITVHYSSQSWMNQWLWVHRLARTSRPLSSSNGMRYGGTPPLAHITHEFHCRLIPSPACEWNHSPFPLPLLCLGPPMLPLNTHKPPKAGQAHHHLYPPNVIFPSSFLLSMFHNLIIISLSLHSFMI
jgi:hypothetical protein